jgi:RHS repeat-associated protein
MTFGPVTVNLSNLDVHVSAPVFAKAGRGIPFNYSLSYDSLFWDNSSTQFWFPKDNLGWTRTGPFGWMQVYPAQTNQCSINGISYSEQQFGPFFDPNGTEHLPRGLVVGPAGDPCAIAPGTSGQANDGSGLIYVVTASGSVVFQTTDGNTIQPALVQLAGSEIPRTATVMAGGGITDANGNQVTETLTPMQAVDTTGTAFPIGGDPWNFHSLSYTDSNGGSQKVTVAYTTVTLATNFGCGALSEYPFTTPLSLPASITYADGSSIQFTYEPTPGFPSSTTGRIASVQLREGGTIGFAYTGANDGINCNDGRTTGLTVTTSDSTVGWSFQVAASSGTTTVTDPKGNQMVVTFATGLETQRKTYQGSSSAGTLLATKLTCYNGNKTNCVTNTTIGRLTPITEVSAITTLPNGLQKEQDTFFNSGNLTTEIDEYDFGANSPGPLVRKTLTTYASLGNNISGRPASLTVCSPSGTDAACNGSGTRIAQTTFGYDETTPASTSGITQHVPVTGSRGNVTSIHRWLNTTNTTLDTTNTFDDTGNALTTTDPGTHKASFTYGACNGTFATQTTMPDTHSPLLAHHAASSTYDCNTGLLLTATDQNGQVTSYSYDAIMRPKQTTFPDGGQTKFSYPSTNQVVVQNKIDSARSTYSTTLVDGYGRPSRSAVANDESTPYDQQDTCYDANGLVLFTSYPYQGNAPVTSPKVCSGAGDTFAYDALGRLTQTTHSDSTAIITTYTGRAAQTTDEGNGSSKVSRIVQQDSLGHSSVCEVYGGAALLGSGGTPADCGLDIVGTGFLTSYSYDTLGNMTTVIQGGLPRAYAYDSLSRLTSETTPEAGTVSYSYSADSLVASRTRPAANLNNASTTWTTKYGYDELHRLTNKSYSSSDPTNSPINTPSPTFNYDEGSVWNIALSNTIGRLSSETVGSPLIAEQIFSYDVMGRPVFNGQCTPYNCNASPFTPYGLGYQYDLLGMMTSGTNGVGVTFGYAHNIAGRLTGMTSSINDATHPATLLSSANYSPSQVTDTLGNGVVEQTTFSPRGFMQSRQVALPSGQPATGSVTIGGALKTYQQQTQQAAPASVTVTMGGSDGTNRVITCTTNRLGVQHCTTSYPSQYGTIQFTVNAGGATIGPISVAFDGNSTAGSLAAGLFSAFPSNSVVTMSNPNGGAAFTLTTTAAGSSTNASTITTSMASNCTPQDGDNLIVFCGGMGWTMTLSGPNLAPTAASSANFSGGQDAVFQTVYDNGQTTINVNNHPDTYSWSGSGTTPTSIAQGLCTAINSDASASVIASTTGFLLGPVSCAGSSTVWLLANQGGLNSDFTLRASSNSVVSSFSVSCPGFPDCSTASLTGGGAPAYSFTLVPAPDGQITSANDLVNGSWTFAYDQFNRLAGSNKNNGQQTFTYDYDRYGNRWHQNAPQGGPAPQYVFDNNNRIYGSGVTYDALGEVLTDGLGNSFTWDAESRLLQVNAGATATYSYDAEGRRVHGPNGEYVYDLAGHMITQMGVNGGWNFGEIYAGGRHLATYSYSTTNFYHGDWLGTKRVMTGVNGAVSETCTGFAFGDGVNCTPLTNWTFNGFTDDIHDPETNLEHTLFRQYSGTEGRWLTPDPYSGSASPSDPQSWNRYAYVSDDPVNGADPSGLERIGSGVIVDFSRFGDISPYDSDPGNPCNDPLFAPVHPLGCPIGRGGFSVVLSLDGIGKPSAVNCFVPGTCLHLPFQSIADHIKEWVAMLPWNNPCIMSPGSDGCGFTSFENLKPQDWAVDKNSPCNTQPIGCLNPSFGKGPCDSVMMEYVTAMEQSGNDVESPLPGIDSIGSGALGGIFDSLLSNPRTWMSFLKGISLQGIAAGVAADSVWKMGKGAVKISKNEAAINREFAPRFASCLKYGYAPGLSYYPSAGYTKLDEPHFQIQERQAAEAFVELAQGVPVFGHSH